jgi:hypothetical protein
VAILLIVLIKLILIGFNNTRILNYIGLYLFKVIKLKGKENYI